MISSKNRLYALPFLLKMLYNNKETSVDGGVKNLPEGDNYMNDKDKLRELLENPYTGELIRANSDLLNYSASNIIACCELLEDCGGKMGGKEFKRYIENIRSMCRNILRCSTVNSSMVSGADGPVTIRVDKFLESVAAGCKRVLGDTVRLVIKDRTNALVSVDPDLLRFLLVGAVRRAISAAPDRILTATISSIQEDNVVRAGIKITYRNPVDQLDKLMPNNFFERYYQDICDILAERMNVKTDYGEWGVRFEMPVAEMEPDKSGYPFMFADPGDFSFYRIMLSDPELG